MPSIRSLRSDRITTLKTVSESDAWKTEYIEANKLIPNYMDTATATEYVTQYEADFMAENGIQ